MFKQVENLNREALRNTYFSISLLTYESKQRSTKAKRKAKTTTVKSEVKIK